MELREKIICAVVHKLVEWTGGFGDEDDRKTGELCADAILAIPEIRDALASQTCACGEEAVHHECSGCSAFHNTAV